MRWRTRLERQVQVKAGRKEEHGLRETFLRENRRTRLERQTQRDRHRETDTERQRQGQRQRQHFL